MSLLASFPLFAVPLIILNLMMFTGNSTLLTDAALTIPLVKENATLTLTWNNLLIMLGVVLLYVEILKATRITIVSVIDHALSLIVFVFFLVQFLIMPAAGNATFLILTLMSMFDVIAGFTITISSARRDFVSS